MSARHDEWFELPLAEDWTIGPAIGSLILVAFILFMAGVWSLLVLGAFYLGSYVTDLLFFGPFFGP